MTPNLADIYDVLRAWAVARPGQVGTYTDLSHEYLLATGHRFEPHGSWDVPLGQLNQRLHAVIGAPALSALVTLGSNGSPTEPGGGFWGSAPNVPLRPSNPLVRLSEWSRIVKEVHNYKWPAALP